MQTARQAQPAIPWVIPFLILFLLGWIPSGRCAPAPVTKLDVSAGTEADEELFLLYLLPQFYEAIITADGLPPGRDRDEQLAEIRGKALQFRRYTESKAIDPRLSREFADVVLIIDASAELFAQVDRDVRAIKRENLGPQLKRGIQKLGGIPGDSLQVGLGPAVGGALVGLGVDLITSFQISDEAKNDAIDIRLREYRRVLSEVDARSKNTTIELLRSRGWSDVEVADETTLKRMERLKLAIQSGDHAEAVKLIRQSIVLNPRNFFAHRLLETHLGSDTNRAPEQLLESARNLVAACRLVPDAAIYEDYRTWALCDAAVYCIEALDKESRAAGRLWKPNDTSAYTVTVLGEMVRRASSTKRHGFNLFLAVAYYANHQFSAAGKLIADLRPFESLLVDQIPEAAGVLDYLQACIDSRKGETATALQFLRNAVGAGCAVSKDWWEDTDLEAVRHAHPKDFAELMAVKATWTIEYGLLSDDIVIRNDSQSALSGVLINVSVVSKGKRHDRQLKAESIPPGKVHRWSNVFSVQKDPGIQAVLGFKCDQSAAETVAEFAAPK